MSESKGTESKWTAGPDFHLPDRVTSWLRRDPYDQLDLARKITSMAIASRVTNLESEIGRLRQKLNDKDRFILDLEDKVISSKRGSKSWLQSALILFFSGSMDGRGSNGHGI
ncbi:hypothetical protein HAX54_001355 [Datura stramonium]|uniref:Uncharacterized protein n=1 Tax=Datura stramonium TaxID=4076 RepID=A0ABS8T3P0_DATST|nr:hypothetical protein [Datura stramonium]